MKHLRSAFFALLLANVAFFAWVQNAAVSGNGHEPQRLEKQLAADKLKIIPPAPPPEAAPTPTPVAPDVTATPVPAPAPASPTTPTVTPPVATAPAAVPTPAAKPALTAVAAGPTPAVATPSAAPQKPAPASKPAPAPVTQCAALTGLSLADARRLQADFGNRAPTAHTSLQAITEAASYWVFIPPLANKAAADKKMKELAALGVGESYLIEAEGSNQYAISLGIFRTSEAAQNRFQELTQKGVRSARTGQRSKGMETARLEIHAEPEVLGKLVQQAGSGITRSECAVP